MQASEIIERLEALKTRSAWERGVKNYAIDLIADGVGDEIITPANVDASTLERDLLNGAANWRQYSRGGCALIYNQDIARALCTPSEYRRTDGGRRAPNRFEDWLDVQARALAQALALIKQQLC